MQMLAILLLSLLQSVACFQQEIAAHDNLKEQPYEFTKDRDIKSNGKRRGWGFWRGSAWGIQKKKAAEEDLSEADDDDGESPRSMDAFKHLEEKNRGNQVNRHSLLKDEQMRGALERQMADGSGTAANSENRNQ